MTRWHPRQILSASELVIGKSYSFLGITEGGRAEAVTEFVFAGFCPNVFTSMPGYKKVKLSEIIPNPIKRHQRQGFTHHTHEPQLTPGMDTPVVCYWSDGEYVGYDFFSTYISTNDYAMVPTADWDANPKLTAMDCDAREPVSPIDFEKSIRAKLDDNLRSVFG